jgi:hypothetical protein
MENKDMPAFPFFEFNENGYGNSIVFNGGDGSRQILPYQTGISKLEFFACNAPADIPGWFKHTPPDIKVTERPDWRDIEPKADRDIVGAWIEDGQDLPDRLKWFSEQMEAHRNERGLFEHANNVAKYFQWRRYYAEQLLKELEK